MDGGFLDALELGQLRGELRSFWPKRGPSWDALAIVRGEGGIAGYILAEGKSYPAEMLGRGCSARSGTRELVESSLAAAKASLGVPATANWLGPYYQYANRLAHVSFLRRHTSRPAWLVNLCFTDDPTKGSTSEAVWRHELARIKRELGFEQAIPFSADVFLPGLMRSELLSETAAPPVAR
jgi:hypothetical protein